MAEQEFTGSSRRRQRLRQELIRVSEYNTSTVPTENALPVMEWAKIKSNMQRIHEENITVPTFEHSTGAGGFSNIGNTCYLNSSLFDFTYGEFRLLWLLSVLRTLFEVEPFREAILEEGKDDNDMPIVQHLRDLFSSMQDNPTQILSPDNFFNSLVEAEPKYATMSQQDPEEFLKDLISLLDGNSGLLKLFTCKHSGETRFRPENRRHFRV